MSDPKTPPTDPDAETRAPSFSSGGKPVDHDAQTTAGVPSASGEAPSSPAPAGLPDSIGQYRVIRLLGEGGMGTVYEAEQAHPKRRVALKVIRAGQVGEALLRRFELEAQVLAHLEHPGIARVYDAGTLDGAAGSQPFFAMELIEGRPLTEHARDAQLSRAERLELLARVCDAVQHAHQKGVIHRDLKPANILIDAHGQPKILDFGVARVTDSDIATATLQTDAGQLVGTLQYMSPEQVSGEPEELDTRSDVWALGVIAYELLAGRLPHEVGRAQLLEAIRAIREDDAVPLGTLDRELRGDVETIVATALERDKERRYESAAALAADLRRYLNDEPISARPPSAGYQLAKFARRNRALVAGAVAVVIALAVGLVAASVGFAQARVARDQALAEGAKAKAINRFLIDDMLKSADPAVTQGREYTVAEALDVASDRMDEAFADQDEIRLELHGVIGEMYYSLGRLDEAEQHFEAAGELAERIRGSAHPDVFASLRNRALVLRERDLLDEALVLVDQAEAGALALYGEGHPEVAGPRAERGAILLRQGRYEDAEPLLAAALPILEAAYGADDRRPLAVRHNLGTAIGSQGRLEEARAVMEDLLELRRNSLGEKHPDTLSTLNNLATIVTELGDLETAEALLSRAVELRTEVLGPEHPATLTARLNLAHVYIVSGRLVEAEPLVRANLAAQESLLGRQHGNTLTTRNQLAYLLEDLGRLAEAEEVYRGSWETWKEMGQGSSPQALIVRNNLGMLLEKKGELEESAQVFAAMMQEARTVFPAGHHYLGIFGSNYGRCLASLGRFAEGEKVLLEAHAALAGGLGDDHERTKTCAERLAALYTAWGRTAEAERWTALAQPAESD